MFAGVARAQLFAQVRDRVVEQGHQPAHHLQRTAVKTRPLSVRTVLVVTARHRIDQQVVDLDSMGLLVALSATVDRQHVFRVARASRVQRMPAILFGTGSDLPAHDGTHRLFRRLVLEYRGGFGQADFLRRGRDAHARFRDRHEQATGQLLPSAQAVRVTARPQRDLQAPLAVGQIPQGAHARVRLGRAGVEQRVQRAWPALLQDLLDQRHR